MLFTDIERTNVQDKAGYKKIQYSCTQAVAYGLHYVWVDTCCIDKRSSAELSEAINSMYSWYQNARICFVYLADVTIRVNVPIADSAFTNSRWFTRGWTLQELIAPSNLIFYSQDWIEIGKKSSLYNILPEITGIDIATLTDVDRLEHVSVAKKMSWASRRTTTRIEDMAYCLMGLFAVNMPLLYGEGERAYIRLQEEIMKKSDDHSLFAWVDLTASPDSHNGMLAKSPACFISSGHIVSYRDWETRIPFSMSNRGLCIDLYLIRHKKNIYIASLDCPAPPDYEGFLGIYLKRVSSIDHQYVRVKPQAWCKLHERGSIETVYVRQSVLLPGPQDVYPEHVIQLRNGPAPGADYKVVAVLPSQGGPTSTQSSMPVLSARACKWIPIGMQYTFKMTKGSSRLAGALLLERRDGERLVIMLGSMDFGVAFDTIATSKSTISEESKSPSFEDLENLFNPKEPGIDVALEYHRVRVTVKSKVHSRVKYYIVDVSVEPIYKPQNLMEILISQPLPPPKP